MLEAFLSRSASLVVAALAAAAPIGSLAAQGGGGGAGGGGFQGAPPRNLQVLPKNLTRAEVTARMRLIAAALGVRCEHCHVITTGPDGREQNDFAADDKDTKKTAREMMRMVNDINNQYLATIMGRALGEREQVSCENCHHGLLKPGTIRAAMLDAVAAKDADSAVALYRDLRARYYGRASYDFGENALLLLVPQNGPLPLPRPAAVALLKLNLEFYPKSVPTLAALAQQLVATGDTAGAVDAVTKAVAIDSTNPQLRNFLNRLRGQRAPAPAPRGDLR